MDRTDAVSATAEWAAAGRKTIEAAVTDANRGYAARVLDITARLLWDEDLEMVDLFRRMMDDFDPAFGTKKAETLREYLELGRALSRMKERGNV
jgi:predicted component of type VI protein secretion system